MKLIAATIAVLALCLAGCGGAASSGSVESGSAGSEFSAPRRSAIGSGSATVTCDSGGPYIGSGKPGWRRLSAHAGPFGLSGAGREFRRIPRRERDGLFHTELPAIVEGHRPVTLWVPSGERKRVGIEVVAGDHRYARVRFVPCEDKPRTIWPTGLALLNRAPVTLRVRVGAWVGALKVGRVPIRPGP